MSAAALLSSEPATAAPASAAAAAPATTAATTTAAPSSLSAVTTAAAAAETKTWVDSIDDPALKTYVQGKQWATPKDVANGYMHLEKLLGGDKVVLPKGEADAEGWARLYKATGRPETPEGYKLPAPAEGDKGFVADASKAFHAAGLSTRQANEIAKWYQEYGGRMNAAQTQAVTTRNAQELEQFKTEQGALFDAKLELGRRAAKQFGFNNEELLAFEEKFGTKTLLTRFAAIGEAMGEHVVTGEGSKTFGMTATGAAAALDELKKDKEFTAKYLSGDVDAKNRMASLQAAAAGMTMDQYRESLGAPSRK
jgi:hypothetical protein